MLITLPGSWARRSRGSDFGDKSSSLGSQLLASMWKRSENPMTKKKTFWSIIKFCLAICKLTNIPIFAIYIYGISHHVCLLIHVQRASLKHTWPPTKEGQSNKVQKPNRTIPLHSISLPLLSRLCRRWTARVETTSTSSSCMHRGRCCAGTLGGY